MKKISPDQETLRAWASLPPTRGDLVFCASAGTERELRTLRFAMPPGVTLSTHQRFWERKRVLLWRLLAYSSSSIATPFAPVRTALPLLWNGQVAGVETGTSYGFTRSLFFVP